MLSGLGSAGKHQPAHGLQQRVQPMREPQRCEQVDVRALTSRPSTDVRTCNASDGTRLGARFADRAPAAAGTGRSPSDQADDHCHPQTCRTLTIDPGRSRSPTSGGSTDCQLGLTTHCFRSARSKAAIFNPSSRTLGRSLRSGRRQL